MSISSDILARYAADLAANDAELHSMGSGDDVYVLGFPGRVMDPISPSATFLQGHIGRLMGMGEQPAASLDDAVLVQHDAVTRGGNSGSPVFNQYGHVIAIHAVEDFLEVDLAKQGFDLLVVCHGSSVGIHELAA